MKKYQSIILAILVSALLTFSAIAFLEVRNSGNLNNIVLEYSFSFFTFLLFAFFSYFFFHHNEMTYEEERKYKDILEDINKKLQKAEYEREELQAKSDELITQVIEHEAQLSTKEKQLTSEISERRDFQKKISKLNHCFFKLGADSRKNVKIITETAGELLGGDFACYNQISPDGQVIAQATWNAPLNFESTIPGEKTLCQDVVLENNELPYIVHDLKNSEYASKDPKIITNSFSTYIGCVVRQGGQPIGAVEVLFSQDRQFSLEEIKIMTILSKIIEVEEDRFRAEENILSSYQHLGLVNRKISILTNLANVKKETNIQDIYDYIVKSGISLSQARMCSLCQIPEENNPLQFKDISTHGFLDDEKHEFFNHLLSNLSELKSITQDKKRKQIIFKEEHFGKCSFINRRKLEHLLALPLINDEKVLGILFLGFPEKTEPIQQELDLYELYAMQAATTLTQIKERPQ